MTENIEPTDAHTEETVVEEPKPEALTLEEVAELKRKAEVSSQNYERAKKAEADKKALEAELEQLKKADLGSMGFASTDDTNRQLADLSAKLAHMEDERRLETVYRTYPALADKRQEFDEYRSQYPSDKMDTVAKLFMAEQGMLDEVPKRKGLEKAGGGKKTTPAQTGMNTEDIKRLRENNYKEYVKQVRSGKIQIG